MTDRELLELAAKAAGFSCSNAILNDSLWGCFNDAQCQTLNEWNPLTDDGDALRLAVKLLFEIDMGCEGIAIRHATGIKVLEAFNNDPYAATRRAIVRAAAEIGRTMK